MQFDPNYSTTLAAAITSSSAREQQLVSELASGLRVSSLSTDPVAVGANVQLQGSISQADAFVQVSHGEQGRLQVTDSTLAEVVTHITSAISLATQGANQTLSSGNLSALAEKAVGLRDSVLSLANTSYQGSYLFSGSQGLTKPFALDNTSTPPGVTYAGDTAIQYTQTPGGQALALSVPGSAIFTSAGGNVLAALNQLVSDLQSGASTALATDTGALSSALSALSAQRASLGTSLSQLTATTSYSQTESATLSAEQTKLLSANTATVATALSAAEVQHQALISVVAGLKQNNLFNYLK